MKNVVEKPSIKNRRARIRLLRSRVQMRHQKLAQRGQNIVLPVAGLAAGLLLPMVGGDKSANPARRASGVIRRTVSRLLSIAVVESVLLLLSGRTPAILKEQFGSQFKETQ